MSKYYILAESTQGNWCIYVDSAILDMRPPFLDLGMSLYESCMSWPSNNTISGFQDKDKILNNGMSYQEASRVLKIANYHQRVNLKQIKKKYRTQHTVRYSIISISKAISLASSLPKSCIIETVSQAKSKSPRGRRRLNQIDKVPHIYKYHNKWFIYKKEE